MNLHGSIVPRSVSIRMGLKLGVGWLQLIQRTWHQLLNELRQKSYMAKGGDGMTRSNTSIFILLITVFTSSGIAQFVDPVEELKACAKMTDRDARFACFDNLGERVLREASADEKPTREKVAQAEAVTATATNAQSLPDEFGKSRSIQYSGLITSCEKGYYGNWYFIFDNGQVWKEVNKRNLRFKECNFNATITQDAFGYKMQIDGVEKTIRVRRNR